jgi:hypothetical protein
MQWFRAILTWFEMYLQEAGIAIAASASFQKWIPFVQGFGVMIVLLAFCIFGPTTTH